MTISKSILFVVVVAIVAAFATNKRGRCAACEAPPSVESLVSGVKKP